MNIPHEHAGQNDGKPRGRGRDLGYSQHTGVSDHATTVRMAGVRGASFCAGRFAYCRPFESKCGSTLSLRNSSLAISLAQHSNTFHSLEAILLRRLCTISVREHTNGNCRSNFARVANDTLISKSILELSQARL